MKLMSKSPSSKKVLTLALAAAAVAAAAFQISPAQAQSVTPSMTGAKLKACFVYIGPRGDIGWTYAHDQGRQIAEKALPWLETKYVESVPEGQATATLDRLVADKCQVIFTTSFGYMDDTLSAAKKYPDVIFAHASGFKRAANVATYMADFYQVYYLDGLMAGVLTKSNKIGYVGNFPLSETKRHINAFALGVRAVNAKATVNVRWINSFYDPAAAKEATEALVADGNDVFAFTEDSPTVVQVAAKHNLPSFSHYSPMQDFGPKTVVSGQLVHWDVIYKDFFTKIHDGTYTAKNLQNVDYWSLLGQGGAELGAKPGVPINPVFVPRLKAKIVTIAGLGRLSVYDAVMKRLAQMSQAKPAFDPYTGPIKDRNGVVRVPAGATASVKDLTSMQWAAPGVTGPWQGEPK